jgi:hypothetical protein
MVRVAGHDHELGTRNHLLPSAYRFDGSETAAIGRDDQGRALDRGQVGSHVDRRHRSDEAELGRERRAPEGAAISGALKAVFGDDPPASTWIGVWCLAREEFLVEIEPSVVYLPRAP